MELSHYTLFNLGYLIVFALLGVFSLTLHTPKDDEYSNFKRARQILGAAFLFAAGYCVVRLILPYKSGDYTTFWLFVLVSLIFSWMTYKAFLVLISSDEKLRRGFVIDGVIPMLMLVIAGVLGLFVPSIRHIIEIAFGVIFITKAIRMFYICDREWRKVNKKLKETYDASPDIRWMRVLLWLSFLFSLSTLWSFYNTTVALVMSVVAPMMFVYMLLKIVNYLPKKIEEMRRQEAVIAYDIDEYDERLLRHLALGYTKDMITNLKGMPFGVKSLERRQNELVSRLFSPDERSGVNACRLVTRALELRIIDIDNLEPDEE